MARSSFARQRADDFAQPSPILPVTMTSPGEKSRRWDEIEETALIEYWREHAGIYTKKTKRHFYDGATQIAALQSKTAGQIKSKCCDIEKRYRETRALVCVAEDPDSVDDMTRRRIVKKFSLFYEVHPFLAVPVGATGDATPTKAAAAPALGAQSATDSDYSASPPPAGVRSFNEPPATGKKRVLVGGSIPRSPPQNAAPRGKRHRAEIDRFQHKEEAAAAEQLASYNGPTAAAGVRRSSFNNRDNDYATLSSSSSFSAPGGAAASVVHIPETSDMIAATTAKLRAEAKFATIRANAALLRERKALLDEGIPVGEIDALLPLESSGL